jgi:hypothetical protein
VELLGGQAECPMRSKIMPDMLGPEVRRPVHWTPVKALQKVSLIPSVVTVEAPHEEVCIVSTQDFDMAGRAQGRHEDAVFTAP